MLSWRRWMSSAVTVLLLVSPAGTPWAAGIGDLLKGAVKSAGGGGSLADNEIVEGLKQALSVGTANATAAAGTADGYFQNPDIKILLPEQIRKMETLIRTAGYGGQLDAFVLSMNRAAERAAPAAKPIFGDALAGMRLDDARRILNGRNDEATRYFQEKTGERLAAAFKPNVHQAMSEVGVTQAYQELDAKVRTIPFAGSVAFDLDAYVTDQALDGLFHLVAREEASIRQNPASRTTELLQKVFSSR
jgi:hypothetical protein